MRSSAISSACSGGTDSTSASDGTQSGSGASGAARRRACVRRRGLDGDDPQRGRGQVQREAQQVGAVGVDAAGRRRRRAGPGCGRRGSAGSGRGRAAGRWGPSRRRGPAPRGTAWRRRCAAGRAVLRGRRAASGVPDAAPGRAAGPRAAGHCHGPEPRTGARRGGGAQPAPGMSRSVGEGGEPEHGLAAGLGARPRRPAATSVLPTPAGPVSSARPRVCRTRSSRARSSARPTGAGRYAADVTDVTPPPSFRRARAPCPFEQRIRTGRPSPGPVSGMRTDRSGTSGGARPRYSPANAPLTSEDAALGGVSQKVRLQESM